MTPVKAINHIGIAVRSLDEQRSYYEGTLGAVFEGVEEVLSQRVRVAFYRIGDIRIELLESTEPTSTIAKFLEKRGEGLHHIAYTVEDIEARIAELKKSGLRMIDEAPRPGAHHTRIAFVHPKSSCGVLTELLRDSVALLPPFDAPAIEAALRRLRVGRLLTGFRGRPPGDVAALIETARQFGEGFEDGSCKEYGGRTRLCGSTDAASGGPDLRDRPEAARRDLEPGLRTADRRRRVRILAQSQRQAGPLHARPDDYDPREARAGRGRAGFRAPARGRADAAARLSGGAANLR